MKRFIDWMTAFLALIALSPVFLLVALLIKWSMPGPVFFSQMRIGRYARPFTIYKFRSMKLNTSQVSITLSSDSRVTPLGRFIRKTKIDELPQLWNILKGEMSLVGPRPDVPGYYDKLQGDAQKIWELRPGLTGLDSVCYPDEQMILDKVPNPEPYYDEFLWPDKVRLNLLYAEHQSLRLDVQIVLNTAWVLVFGKQAFPLLVGGEKVKGEAT